LSIGYFKKIPAKNKPLFDPFLTAPGQFSTPSWLGKHRMIKKAFFCRPKAIGGPERRGMIWFAAKGGSG
jgi:hypothetical protein